MKPREYVGPWACVTCGSVLWASGIRRDRPYGLRCNACSKGQMIPERRLEPRPRRRERRRTYTATL